MPSPLPRWVLRVFRSVFPEDNGLPRFSVGSAPTLPVSRPAQRSLTLRPACSLTPRGGFLLKCFSPVRYLLEPPQVLPAGATVAGRDSHPLETTRLSRRTEKCGLVPERVCWFKSSPQQSLAPCPSQVPAQTCKQLPVPYVTFSAKADSAEADGSSMCKPPICTSSVSNFRSGMVPSSRSAPSPLDPIPARQHFPHGLPPLTSTLSLLKKPSDLASSASSHGQAVVHSAVAEFSWSAAILLLQRVDSLVLWCYID
jgi:hypothetical protein